VSVAVYQLLSVVHVAANEFSGPTTQGVQVEKGGAEGD
jgi:hypothetical protein